MRCSEKNAPLYYAMVNYLTELRRLSSTTSPAMPEEAGRVSKELDSVADKMTEKYVGKKGSYHSSITGKTLRGYLERFSHFGPKDTVFVFRYEEPNKGFDYVCLSDVDFDIDKDLL